MSAGGILLLDKPFGLSSNAALQRVRRCLGGIKAGHTGSLDPLATGMLPICVGEATKVAGWLLSERKCYEFELRLGEATATGDAEGAVTERAPVPTLSPESIETALAQLRGLQLQTPPMYSALKHQGQPLYRLARQGQTIERAARPVQILELSVVDVGVERLCCRVLCTKGTYVRVLGEDLARALGTCGYLGALRRIHVDPFAGEPMTPLAALEASPRSAVLLPADRALPHLAAAHFAAAGVAALRHGQAATPSAPRTTTTATAPPPYGGEPLLRMYGPDGRFLGLGRPEADGRVAPRRLLADDAYPRGSAPVP